MYNHNKTKRFASRVAEKAFASSVGEVQVLLPDFENIPVSLHNMPFAVWTAEQAIDDEGNPKVKPNGQPAIMKAPRNLQGYNISKNRPQLWTSFDACRTGFDHTRHCGVGVLLQASMGMVGIDLDDIVSLNAAVPALGGLMRKARAAGIYCEKSPSKTGLHLFVRGALPSDEGRRKGGIELYSNAAFLTLTGVVAWPGDAIDGQWLVDELLAIIDAKPQSANAAGSTNRALSGGVALSHVVEDLIKDL